MKINTLIFNYINRLHQYASPRNLFLATTTKWYTLLLFLIYLVFSAGNVVGQTITQNKGEDSIASVLLRLIHHPKAIPYIYTQKLKGVIPDELIPAHFKREEQYLIKTKKQLFAGVDGSGLLYELRDSSGRLKVTRIDQSEHHGNNFGALRFTLNDTIYALGGYGFWKSNGQLRYFNTDSKQWSLIKLNQDIHFYHPLAWIDVKTNQLYCFGSYVIDQGLNEPVSKDALAGIKRLNVLNIQTGTWRELGEMKTIYDIPADKINLEEMNPDGVRPACDFNGGYFMTILGKHHIDDFIQNQRLEPTKQFYLKFSKFYKFRWNILYFDDSTMYYGNPEINALDSVPFRKNDFIATGKKVYTPISSGIFSMQIESRDTGFLISGIAGGFIFFIAIAFWRNRIQRKKQNIQQDATNAINSVSELQKNVPLFDEFETELIRFILEKSKATLPTTVPELNRILGLADKNEAVQKKNRSEKINRINEKWKQHSGEENLLIQRRRSEFDKRNFEYYIEKTLFSKLKLPQV